MILTSVLCLGWYPHLLLPACLPAWCVCSCVYIVAEPAAAVAESSSSAGPSSAAGGSSDSYSSASPDASRAEADDEEAERVQQAVEVVAEMQLTAEQLKVRWLAGRGGGGGYVHLGFCAKGRIMPLQVIEDQTFVSPVVRCRCVQFWGQMMFWLTWGTRGVHSVWGGGQNPVDGVFWGGTCSTGSIAGQQLSRAGLHRPQQQQLAMAASHVELHG